jgi:hypothetical protein
MTMKISSTTESLALASYYRSQYGRPSEKVTYLTMQSATQFIKNIGPIHSRAIVIEPEQGWIRHTRFLSQAIQRPPLAGKDFTKFAHDHSEIVAEVRSVYQAILT